jgi:DNA-binding transcriptional LysR family regulator
MWTQGVITQIELRQLRYFAAVAEYLSFCRAAKALHVSQPPLSRQVRSLEHSIGALLLIRSRTGVSLTPAGAAFLGEVRSFLGGLDSAIATARDLAEERLPAA